nr:Nad4L [Porphyridium purpureum]UBY46132.1 Nad4L [Porphyridium purpureum]
MNINYTVLSIAIAIFTIGLIGVQLNRNVLIVLMSIEISILSVNFYLIITSFLFDDIGGQILALVSLSVAASESCIALAIFVVYFRITSKIQVELVNLTKA